MSQKKMLIIAAVVVIVLVIAGGAFFVLSKNGSSSNNSNVPSEQAQQTLPTLAPSAIGMSLAVTKQGKSVTMTVDKLDGITGLDYEVTYTANSNNNDVPRGVIGHIDIKPSDTEKIQEVVLGTCSDVCHYDTVVSPVKFSVKVTKTDGKIYEVDQSISL